MGSRGIHQGMKDLRLCEKIANTLCGDGPQRVVLATKAGTGKTRLARMVSEYVTKERQCYFTLWLHLNKRFDDELSLYENIAFQIEVYDRDEKDGKKVDDLLRDLKEKISAKIFRKKRSANYKMKILAKGETQNTSSGEMEPYLLLVLDDEGYKTSEDTVMKDLGLESFLEDYAPLKILLTKRIRETESHAMYKSQDTERGGEIELYATPEPHNEKSGWHTTDESQDLLDTLTHHYLQDLFESLILRMRLACCLSPLRKLGRLMSH